MGPDSRFLEELHFRPRLIVLSIQLAMQRLKALLTSDERLKVRTTTKTIISNKSRRLTGHLDWCCNLSRLNAVDLSPCVLKGSSYLSTRPFQAHKRWLASSAPRAKRRHEGIVSCRTLRSADEALPPRRA